MATTTVGSAEKPLEAASTLYLSSQTSSSSSPMQSFLLSSSSLSSSSGSSPSNPSKSYEAAKPFKLKKAMCGMPTSVTVINEVVVIICLNTSCERLEIGALRAHQPGGYGVVTSIILPHHNSTQHG
jgi:hypothetical protein